MHSFRCSAVAPVALTVLLGCFVALAGCESETRSVPFVAGTVDAFEDGDPLTEAGNAWEAIAEGPGTHADMYVPGGGFGESSHFLAFEGVRPDGASSAQVVGVRVSLLEKPAAADPDREQLAADVSGYEGLSFALRGTPGTYIVQIGSTLIDDFDYYNAYVEVGEEWNEYRIPFSEFNQEGFGQPVPWNPRSLSHIAYYPILTGSFRFALDDVRFY